MKYKLEIEVDDEKNQTKISAQFDPWLTLALLLEAVGTQMNAACQFQEWPPEKMIEYVQTYVQKVGLDYKTKKEL